LEEAALPFQPSRVDLPNLIEEAVQGIKPLAYRQSKVGVSSQAAQSLPPVMADPTRVTQVLNNLLYNALRHTPRGGVIVVEAEPLTGGNEIEVRVVDTGTGIEPEKLPHIFDRFYRGGAAREDGGSGLGLAIVKQLVEAQGGRVRAESTPGEGTRICFTLPVSNAISPRLPRRELSTSRLAG
ncbi:MAG: sensor histidine kinase, partial [Thermomicrobiales bacterium]